MIVHALCNWTIGWYPIVTIELNVMQELSAPVVDGNGAVTGHIISTTIGGKNGEPKQVCDNYPHYQLII